MNIVQGEWAWLDAITFGILLFFILLGCLIHPVQAEETPFSVDFSANVTDGYSPLAVQFTNLVTGNQVSGNWTINNETFEQLPARNTPSLSQAFTTSRSPSPMIQTPHSPKQR